MSDVIKRKASNRLLGRLVTSMQQAKLWQTTLPSAQALQSKAPFCCDTLSFEQWLQFVFVPSLARLIQDKKPLPEQLVLRPMAEMSWQRTEALETVFQVLVEFDRLYQPLEQLQILYRDESLIAVNKPAGLLVHRSLIDKYETRFAVQALRDQIGQRVYPVHRLDKPTSGVLLFALNPEMARSMTELFTAGRVEKRYQALVRGFTPDEGMIDYPLREKLDKIADKRARKDKPAQPALSLYRTLQRFELPIPVRPYQSARYSLVELWPKTGRKHQLRRHMAHLRHPILGDVNHGDGKHNAMVRDRFGFVGLALTACEMNFEHPLSRQMIKITSGTEDRFQALLAKWRDYDHSPPYIEPASQREESAWRK